MSKEKTRESQRVGPALPVRAWRAAPPRPAAAGVSYRPPQLAQGSGRCLLPVLGVGNPGGGRRDRGQPVAPVRVPTSARLPVTQTAGPPSSSPGPRPRTWYTGRSELGHHFVSYRLGLKDQQEREIVHVLVDCCLQEKTYNPFYAFLAGRLCDYERRFQVTGARPPVTPPCAEHLLGAPSQGAPSRVTQRSWPPMAGGCPCGFPAPRPLPTFFSDVSAEVRGMTGQQCPHKAGPDGWPRPGEGAGSLQTP